MSIKRYPIILCAAWAACLAAVAVAGGCASRKQAARVDVLPAGTILAVDSARRADVCASFRVPPRYVGKRARLFITPVVATADSTYGGYPPVVLDAPIYAKKKERAAVLRGETDTVGAFALTRRERRDTVTVRYGATLQLPDSVAGGEVLAVLSADGCGACSGIDTVPVAGLSDLTPLLAVKDPWLEPDYVPAPKLRQGSGTARLQFVINRYDINLRLGNNRAELDTMLAALRPIVADTLASLDSVHIVGVASADGSLPFNTRLSRDRANSARRWLLDSLRLSGDEARKFTVASRPEGWLPVLAAMRLANDPDTAGVADVLNRLAGENDDVQERLIRRLPAWKRIRSLYLPSDRKVDYSYFYRMRSFNTDAELLALYDVRPDAFSEGEFLRVSALRATPQEKLDVYATLLHYYPASCTAASNAATLHLRGDSVAEARQVLDAFADTLPCLANAKAALYVRTDELARAESLLLPVAHADSLAHYNLGVVKARRYKLDEAYDILAPYADVNAALVALALGRTAEADTMLTALADTTALAEYARALVAARLHNGEAALEHLARAAACPALRERARTEYEFVPYRRTEAFEEIVNADSGEEYSGNEERVAGSGEENQSRPHGLVARSL